jgi:membrane-associated phospholipid phosphatase
VKAILKAYRYFLIPYCAFLVFGLFILFLNTKEQIHITINHYHHPFLDNFFYYLTFLGDGVMTTLVAVMLLAIKFRYTILVALSSIFSAIITQLLKHFVFEDHVRPKKFFEGVHDLYFIPGVQNYLYNSFPSGHTTSAFALYLSLALIVKKRAYKFLFFWLALLVGYSRMYLSQHFLEDVCAGSFIGVVITLVVYYILQQKKNGYLEKSLVSVFQ